MEREVETLELGTVPRLDVGIACVDAFAEFGERSLWGEASSNSHSSSALGNRL